MLKININEGQSLLDIAIQYYGTIESVVDIAMANGKSITGLDISSLKLPTSDHTDIDILNYCKKHTIHPATAQLSDQMAALVAQYEPVPDDSEGGNTTFSREYTFEYAKEFGTII